MLATVGSGRRSLNKENPNKIEGPYFQSYMGTNNNPTYGFLKLDVSSTALTGTFVRASGGSYTDQFTITRSGATADRHCDRHCDRHGDRHRHQHGDQHRHQHGDQHRHEHDHPDRRADPDPAPGGRLVDRQRPADHGVTAPRRRCTSTGHR